MQQVVRPAGGDIFAMLASFQWSAPLSEPATLFAEQYIWPRYKSNF